VARIAVVADCHVANHRRWGGEVIAGLNQRARDCVATIARAVDLAVGRRCSALFVLGDLFDNVRPTPQLVAETARALACGTTSASLTQYALNVYVLLGNHDRASDAPGDHACASLALRYGVHVIEKPTVVLVGTSDQVEVLCVPYRSGRADDWLRDDVLSLNTECPATTRRRVVFTHVGIWDEETPEYMRAARDAVGVGQARWLCEQVRASYLMAGNWHHQRSWLMAGGPAVPRTLHGHRDSAAVVIPGTLCPASFSDAFDAQRADTSVNGQLVVLNTSRPDVEHTFVAGPRFRSITEETMRSMVEDEAADQRGYVHYFKVRVPRDRLAEVCEVARGSELVNKSFRFLVEPEPDDETTASAVEVAAARGTEDALAAYAEELQDVRLPGTVDGVARRLREYRTAARR
jgi:hypothetical protein